MRRIWPFRHFGLKVLSVVLAVMLWLLVAGEETVERGLRVPLELQQFPDGLELVGDAPITAEVRVRGASGTLSRIAPGDIVAVLDLRGVRPGRRLFHLTPEQVHAPSGVDIVSVAPATVVMSLERTASRTVPVVPAIDGKPDAGYIVGAVTVNPSSVELVGPAGEVGRIANATTEAVSVAGARGPVQEVVTVDALDPVLRLKTPRSATVRVDIVPAPPEQTVRNRPIHLRNLGPNLSGTVLPPGATVGIRGHHDAPAQIDPNEVNVYVDVAGLGVGRYTLAAHTDGMPDADVTRIDPSTIQVRISSAKN